MKSRFMGRRKKKPLSYGPVRKRGGGQPLVRNQNSFFLRKKKRKRKKCILIKKNIFIWTCFMF